MDYSACGRAGNGFPAETAADSAENCNKDSSTDGMIENGDERSKLSRDGFNPHIPCPTSGFQEGKQETTMAKEGFGAAMKHQIATETGIDITAQMLPSGGTQSHVHVVRTAVSETSAQQPTDVGQKNSILHHLIDHPPISYAPFFPGKPTANIATPFSVATCSDTGTSNVIMGDDLEIYENIIKPTDYVTKNAMFNKLELPEDALARKHIISELMCDPQGTTELLAIHSEYKGDSGVGDSELRIDNTTDLYSDLETLEQNKNYLKISKKIMKIEDLSDVYMSTPEICQLKKCDPAEEIKCMWVKHSDPSPYIQRLNAKDCVSDKLYNASSLAKVWHVPRSCLPGNNCKGMPTCGTECVEKCCGEILNENLVTSKPSGPLCGPFGQPINASMSVFTSLEQQMNNQCPTPTKDHNSFDSECTEGSEGLKDLDCDLSKGCFTKVKHCEEDGIYYFKEKEQNKPPFISVNKDIHDMGFKNTDTAQVETCSKETGVTLGRLTAQLGISSGEDNTNMSTSAEGDSNNCNSITLVQRAFHKDGELQDHKTSVITIQTKGTENSTFSHKCSQLEDIKEMSNIKSVLCHSPSNMGVNTSLEVQTSVYTRNSTGMKNSIKTFKQNDAYSGVMNAEHHRDIELSKQRQKPCFRDSRHSSEPPFQSLTSAEPPYYSTTSYDYPPNQKTSSSVYQNTVSFPDPANNNTTSSTVPSYRSTDFSHDVSYQNKTSSEPVYQSMTFSDGLPYQSKPPSDNAPYQSTTSSRDPHYQSTTSFDHLPNQNTTYSADPHCQSSASFPDLVNNNKSLIPDASYHSTDFSTYPCYQSTTSLDPTYQNKTSSDDPPHQSTTSSDDPPHQSTTSSDDPPHLCTTFLDPTYQNMTSSGDLAYQSTISSDDPLHQSTTTSDDPKHQSTTSSDDPKHQSTTNSDDPPFQSTTSSDNTPHQSTSPPDNPQHQSTTSFDDPSHQRTTSSDDTQHKKTTSSCDPLHQIAGSILDSYYQDPASPPEQANRPNFSTDRPYQNTIYFDPLCKNMTSSIDLPYQGTTLSDEPSYQITGSSLDSYYPNSALSLESDNIRANISTDPPCQSKISCHVPPHHSTISSDEPPHQSTTVYDDSPHQIISTSDSDYQSTASSSDPANDRTRFSNDPSCQSITSFNPIYLNMTSFYDSPYQSTTSSEDLPHQINNVSADSICQTTISCLKLPYQSTASSPDPANDSINSFDAPFYHSTDFSSYPPSQSMTSSDPPYQSMSTFADSPCQSVTSFPDQPYQVTSSMLKSTFQSNNTSQDQSGQRENIYSDLSSQGLCNNTVTGNLCTSSSPDVTKPIQEEYGALVKKKDCAFLEELRRIFLDCQGQGLTILDSGIVLTKNVTVDNSIALIALRDGSELGMGAPPSKLFFYYQLRKHFYITKQLSEQWYCAQDRITKVTMLMKKVPVTSNWMKQLHNFLLLPKHPRLLTPYAAISNRTGSILFLMEDKPLLGTRTLEMAPLRYEVNIPARILEIMIFLGYCKINNILPRNIEDSILYTPQGLWFDPSSLDNNDDLYELQKCLKTSLSLFLCRGQQEFDPCLEALLSIACHLLEEDQIHQALFLITSHQGPFPFSLPHF